MRIVVDSRLDTPLNAKLLDGGPVLIAAAVDNPEAPPPGCGPGPAYGT